MKSERKRNEAKRLRFVLLLCVPWFFASLPAAIGIYLRGEPSGWLEWWQFMWPAIPAGVMLGQWLSFLLTTDA